MRGPLYEVTPTYNDRVSDPGMPQPPDVPFGDIFNEVPLFREIQRVLLSGAGPVNWELARQVGIAMASWNREDPAPSEEDRRGLEDTVRAAELHVADFTGLAPPGDVAPVLAYRRGQWVEANAQELKDLVEPSAARASDAFAKAQAEGAPEEAAQMAQAVLGQISPLLLGAQAGTVFGTLGQRALGQYDVAVPRSGAHRLYFVVPNIAQFERDWSVDPVEFRAWVALHEVVHRFALERPWTHEHLLGLVRDYASTLEIDVAGLRERLEQLDPSNPEAMQRMFESGEGLFGEELDPEQRLKLARVQSFMAISEGYGDHVTHALGGRMLSSLSQIEEAVGRGRESEVDDPFFARLLGIPMERALYQKGREFCDRVVEQTDEATLARVWEAAESLPSMPEIEEPTLWLSRIA
jgi:putative hydrolase